MRQAITRTQGVEWKWARLSTEDAHGVLVVQVEGEGDGLERDVRVD